MNEIDFIRAGVGKKYLANTRVARVVEEIQQEEQEQLRSRVLEIRKEREANARQRELSAKGVAANRAKRAATTLEGYDREIQILNQTYDNPKSKVRRRKIVDDIVANAKAEQGVESIETNGREADEASGSEQEA